jgi:hypothetical protein
MATQAASRVQEALEQIRRLHESGDAGVRSVLECLELKKARYYNDAVHDPEIMKREQARSGALLIDELLKEFKAPSMVSVKAQTQRRF